MSSRLTFALLALLPLTGCIDNPPGKPDPARRPLRPGQVTDFAELFSRNCAGCHGKEGKGQPAPPLNDALFLESLAPADADKKQSDAERTIQKVNIIAGLIRSGRKGSLMPAFGDHEGGSLTEQQVNILAAGIVDRWGKKPDVSAPIPPYLAGDVVGRADKGRILFSMACATCHGKNGEGTTGAGALNNPNFLALLSDQALRRFVITGRPDLGQKMPNFAEDTARKSDDMKWKPLTSQDVADLVALLATWRKPGPVAQK